MNKNELKYKTIRLEEATLEHQLIDTPYSIVETSSEACVYISDIFEASFEDIESAEAWLASHPAIKQ